MTRRIQKAGMERKYTELIQTPQKLPLRGERTGAYASDWPEICEVKMSHRYEVLEPSGIYQILCKRNRKIYVGSSVDIELRWKVHRRALNGGAHYNSHLQWAWNRYGEKAFTFKILELVADKGLLASEQSWIARLRATDRTQGFNVKRYATAAGWGPGLTWPGFRDPDGNPVTVTNLHEFCRRHRLDFPSMHRLARGESKLKSYKGWTHVNSVRVREYIKVHEGYVDPGGHRVAPIRNLAAFCRERGLDDTHMVAVAMGRIASYRGWTHIRGRVKLNPKTHVGFIAPNGMPTLITNLAAFCRANGLCKVHMHEVKAGRRPSHKGWTWRKPNI